MARLLQLEGVAITPSALSHYELGRRALPVKDRGFVEALARVLKMAESEIYRLSGIDLAVGQSPAAERAAHIVDMLPAEKQQIALKMLESLIQ